MNWPLPPHGIPRVPGLPANLQDLASKLRSLALRVRSAVGEQVGENASRAVRDLLERVWHNPAEREVERRPLRSADAWPSETDDDWLSDEQAWEQALSQPRRRDEPGMMSPNSRPSTEAIGALVLQAGGWWLHRRGSWLGAFGVSVLVGGLLYYGGPLAVAWFSLLEAVCDLYSLDGLLNAGGQMIPRC